MCILFRCKRCNCDIVYAGHGRYPKYCKKCGKEVNRYREMMRLRRKRSLGFSNLWEHPYLDFNKEKEVIDKEKRRIGI